MIFLSNLTSAAKVIPNSQTKLIEKLSSVYSALLERFGVAESKELWGTHRDGLEKFRLVVILQVPYQMHS
jgi:hypothetical protein